MGAAPPTTMPPSRTRRATTSPEARRRPRVHPVADHRADVLRQPRSRGTHQSAPSSFTSASSAGAASATTRRPSALASCTTYSADGSGARSPRVATTAGPACEGQPCGQPHSSAVCMPRRCRTATALAPPTRSEPTTYSGSRRSLIGVVIAIAGPMARSAAVPGPDLVDGASDVQPTM